MSWAGADPAVTLGRRDPAVSWASGDLAALQGPCLAMGTPWPPWAETLAFPSRPPPALRTPGSRPASSFPALCPGVVLLSSRPLAFLRTRAPASGKPSHLLRTQGDVPGAECRWGLLSSARACQSQGAAAPPEVGESADARSGCTE